MLNAIHNYLNPNTASVLTKITAMIDALDNVNTRHTAKAMREATVANAAWARSEAAFSEASTANAAAKKIASAFGVAR